MGRTEPRRAGMALRAALRRSAPRTGLAAVQTAWADAVGEAIAAVTEPVAERDGVLTVRCEGATWAQELHLMEAELRERLGEQIGEACPRSFKFLVGQPTQ